jgi:phosphoenolpyruvate carboxylase
MNYGLVSAVLLNKIALQRLHKLSQEIGVAICPIVGVGSAPFRGNLRPQTVERVVAEYPGTYTFTVQSSFKYDHPPEEVRKGILKLYGREIGLPQEVDEQRCLEIISKYYTEYQRQITPLAKVINELVKYVPSRRKRKLHVGLFGYSRSMEGIKLPRVITFVAALYSLGLPPEILGLNALDKDDMRFIKQVYVNFEDDLRDSLRYLNQGTTFILREIKAVVENFGVDFQEDGGYRELTGYVARLLSDNETGDLRECVLRAASLRGFLG